MKKLISGCGMKSIKKYDLVLGNRISTYRAGIIPGIGTKVNKDTVIGQQQECSCWDEHLELEPYNHQNYYCGMQHSPSLLQEMKSGECMLGE